MTAAQELAERVVNGMMVRDEFSRWLGVQILEIAPGRCRCRMEVRPEMVNGFGVAHGAIVFALADSAFAFACNTEGHVTMSIENGISYPRPVHPGDDLTAIATEESGGRRIAFFLVRVTNQREEIVALFRGTAYRTDREHP